MSSGNITRRGQHSWRLKFEAGDRDPATGKRVTRFVTVRGTKKDAQRELTRILSEIENGTAVDPSKVTIAEYIRGWLDGADHLGGKTAERYRGLVEQQIVPHLGGVILQKLRPSQIVEWHTRLLRRGGKDGAPLGARTVGHAHRVLHTAIAKAAELEIVGRNVASLVRPPKVEAGEVEILMADQIGEVLGKLRGHRLLSIAAMALGAGLRRGEICALRWSDVDLEQAVVRVEQAVEETTAGIKIKGPKTRQGRRSITLPAYAAEALRSHWTEHLRLRLALGLGRPGTEDLVFTLSDGSPWAPDYLSRAWRRATLTLGLPSIGLHALRHSHASALIAAGVDVLTISRRLGHATPAFTLSVYGHLFANTDAAAAKAIDAVMGAKSPA
jgi:integrase